MGASIRYRWEKLKSLAAEPSFYLALLMILLAVASYELGQQSVLGRPVPVSGTGGRIELTTVPVPVAAPAAALAASEAGEETVVASRNGTRYHLPTCPGARQIAEQNKITFTSIAAAEAAGYTRAANCP